MDLSGVMANPKVRDMLMTAGLTMLANNQNRVGVPAQSFGSSLGQGFLTGMQYAKQQEEDRQKQAQMEQELALRKQYQEGQLSHLKNLEDVSWANLGLSRDQFLDNSAFRRDELAERKRQNDLAAQQHQASLGLQERQFGAQQDWQQRKFDEDVRRYNEEAPMRQAQQQHLGNQVQQENQALELQKARQQWIPAANRALQKVYQAKNSGQSPQLSDEEFGAIASVYGDKPEFLSKLFEGQYVPFTDPDTGQTMNVPIQLMMQYKMKQLSGGGDDSTSGLLGAIQSLGGALTGTKPSPAQNPLVSQYAQRVQQAMAGKTPEQQELIKQQMRQELSGVDPAFLSAIGL